MNSIIKLINGETIIAEIAHQDENKTSVLDPLALEIGESPNGNPMLLAMTWIPLTKKINLISLNTSHVVAIADCDEDMDKYYLNSLNVLKNNPSEIENLEEDMTEEYLDQDSLQANTVH